MATETKNPLADLIDTSVINDGSGLAPGAEQDVATSITNVRSELKTALKASRELTKMLMAVAYNSMVFSRSILNAAGYPIWSLATDKATETVQALMEALYDEVFAIPADASDEVKKEYRKERADNLAKVRNNRTRVFVEAFITDYVLNNSPFTEEQKAQMLKPGFLKWSDGHKQYPDVITLKGDVPTFLKKPIAEHYKRSGLDVPEKFGGAPKDKNSKNTKDKKISPDTFDMAAVETQATFTQLRGIQSIEHLLSAYVRAGLDAETITDRDEISLVLQTIASTATLYDHHVSGEINVEQRATLNSLVALPNAVEDLKKELAASVKK